MHRLDLSFIRVNQYGKLIIKALDSDVGVEQSLEQLFTPWYIKRY